MKRIILSLITVICAACMQPANAETLTKTYDITFSPKDFEVRTVKDGISFVTSPKYALYSDYDTTKPASPVYYLTLLLPPQMEVKGFTYTKESEVFAKDVTLGNCVLPVPTDGQARQISYVADYAKKAYNSEIQFVENSCIGRYRLAHFKVKPFTYDARTKALALSQFHLSLTMETTTETDTVTVNDMGNRYYSGMKSFNSTDIDVLYAPKRVVSNSLDTFSCDFKTVKYWIITSNTLKSAFQTLANWKKEKGLNVEIKTVESIYNTYTTGTNAYRIRRFLYDHKGDAEEQYVLLGGDETIIPVVYCKRPSGVPVGKGAELIPCDAYYSCLQSVNCWYANSSNVVTIRTNYTLSNYLGRCPVRTEGQVNTFVSKLISYEKNPSSSWGNNILFMGNTLGYEDTITNKSDGDYVSRQIAQTYVQPYIGVEKIKYLFNTSTNLYDTEVENPQGNGGDRYVNASRVAQQLKSNYSVICEITHGGMPSLTGGTGWNYGFFETYSSYFTPTMANSMFSLYPKVIISGTCYTNYFDSDENSEGPCLGEAFIRGTSRVVGVIGNTREGYVDSYNYLGIEMSYKLNAQILNALYNPMIAHEVEGHLGKAFVYAKMQLSYHDNSFENFLYSSLNLMGDPEMNVMTVSPKYFPSGTYAYLDDTELIVNTSGVRDCHVSVLQYSGEDRCCYNLYNVDSLLRLKSFFADSMDVILQKQNYRQRAYKVYPDVYFQNQDLNNHTSQGYRVFIGKNIIPWVEEGTVDVSGGNNLFRGKKSITIKDGFSFDGNGTLFFEFVE